MRVKAKNCIVCGRPVGKGRLWFCDNEKKRIVSANGTCSHIPACVMKYCDYVYPIYQNILAHKYHNPNRGKELIRERFYSDPENFEIIP